MVIDPAASGPDTHLDPDLMADLYDGLLAPDAAAAARGHLASCERCAEDFALITMDFEPEAGLGSGTGAETGFETGSPTGSATGSATGSGLGPAIGFPAGSGRARIPGGGSGPAGLLAFEALPPEPIPAEVAIRIEAALHREPPLTVQNAAPSAAPQHSASARRPRRFRLMFGSLAGATLVVAGAFAGIAALNSGGAESGSAKSSSASQFSGNDSESHSTMGQNPAAGAAPNAVPHTSGLAAAPSAADLSVEQQAEQLLGRIGQSQVAGTSGEAKSDTPAFACPPSGFEHTAPLGMASITYQGRPAELLVYPKPGDAAHAAVFVVAADTCTASAPGVVLDATEVPRR